MLPVRRRGQRQLQRRATPRAQRRRRLAVGRRRQGRVSQLRARRREKVGKVQGRRHQPGRRSLGLRSQVKQLGQRMRREGRLGRKVTSWQVMGRRRRRGQQRQRVVRARASHPLRGRLREVTARRVVRRLVRRQQVMTSPQQVRRAKQQPPLLSPQGCHRVARERRRVRVARRRRSRKREQRLQQQQMQRQRPTLHLPLYPLRCHHLPQPPSVQLGTPSMMSTSSRPCLRC
jgi:hypothetical protein